MIRSIVPLSSLLVAALPACAQTAVQTTIACSGRFHDLGLTTDETSTYRVDADGVQVWDQRHGWWVRYSCLGRCFADRQRLVVQDSYATVQRGYVGHDMELDLATGRLNEAWRVRDDVLEFVAVCDIAADPHPDAAVIAPSTTGRSDYSEWSIAHGLPLPAPRRSYELPLRTAGVEGRARVTAAPGS